MTGTFNHQHSASPCFLILGSGRLATHLSHYLELQGLNRLRWARAPATHCNSVSVEDFPDPELRLVLALKMATHVLLAISDSALVPFIEAHKDVLKDKRLVHFSGSHFLDAATGAHPLMTFGDSLYTLNKYKEIPFILDSKELTLSELLPGLDNPSHYLAKELKPLYHAYCVASGNFTCILWSAVMESLPKQLQLPSELMLPYLRQVAANIEEDHTKALTGPLSRGDNSTIEKNLSALEGSSLHDLYKAFVSFYNRQNS